MDEKPFDKLSNSEQMEACYRLLHKQGILSTETLGEKLVALMTPGAGKTGLVFTGIKAVDGKTGGFRKGGLTAFLGPSSELQANSS